MKVHYPKLYNIAHLSLNFLLLPKDLTIIFYLLLLQLALCRVAALKSLPVHHPYCRLYFSFDPLRSVKIFRVFQIYCTLRIIILTEF